MTTSRLVVLLLVLVAGFSAIFMLPAADKNQPVGVKLYLPEYVGTWYGTDQKISEREQQVLAADTEFARKQYTNATGDVIFASIVLSGHDLDNSIHRPERCLPAQGWIVAASSRVKVPLAGPVGRALEVTRLQDVREVPAPNGRMIPLYNVNYYWFVGYHHLTASHLERTWMDIHDRVLNGYNQRWAYVTVAATVTKGLRAFGRSESETDALLKTFIIELTPKIINQESFERASSVGGS
jgi:EpsI family protein